MSFDALSVIIAIAQIILRPRVLLLRRRLVETNGLGQVLFGHPLTFAITIGQVKLRFAQTLIDSELKESDALGLIDGQTTFAVEVTPPQVALGVGAGCRTVGSMGQNFAHNGHRLAPILGQARRAGFVTPTVLILGIGVALGGGFLKPFQRGLFVKLATLVALQVTSTNAVLRIGIAVVSLGKPVLEFGRCGCGGHCCCGCWCCSSNIVAVHCCGATHDLMFWFSFWLILFLLIHDMRMNGLER
mmetsp:Transcript_2604/g.6568  ORF Transcript_2604/g.6568 Transcript_2604/m.6568 type:complete len:244 (+) Transcript_2604:3058-3789(+)